MIDAPNMKASTDRGCQKCISYLRNRKWGRCQGAACREGALGASAGSYLPRDCS